MKKLIDIIKSFIDNIIEFITYLDLFGRFFYGSIFIIYTIIIILAIKEA